MARERRAGTAGRGRAKSDSRKIGYAVIGLGHIAQATVLPAFAHAQRNTRLVALVSGEEEKRRALSRRYGTKAYSYEDLDSCLADEEVDAAYIVLPNTLHKECAVRAARAGVHVLVEKPMATSSADCEEMIRAARDSGVKLMVAYRLHFEEANLSTIDAVQSGKIGEPRFFSSEFSHQVEEDDIRTEAQLGGGALWDLGVYCVNAARRLFRDEPVEAFAIAAAGRDDRFREVPEGWSALLRFPSDLLSSFTVSFGAAATSRYRIVGTKGDIWLDPAYGYSEALVRHMTVGGRTRSKTFGPRDQFAPLIVRFSEHILEGTEPEPSGFEGLADVRVIEALLESTRTGRGEKIAPARKEEPELPQEMRVSPAEQPPVHAESPHESP